MRYDALSVKIAVTAGIAWLSAAGFGCKESLPVYVDPQNVMLISIAAVEQLDDHLAPPGKQMVRIILQGVNMYEEPFLDSVRFDGTMKIYWERQPSRFKTLRLTQKDLTDPSLVSNGKMLLVPAQAFSMELFWNMRSDDGVYLPWLMNFAWLSRRICGPNVACADPETFIIETTLNVYDRLGVLRAPESKFTFVARVRIT
ncbi:MAG TPA: hypothetical protein VI932_12710 [Bacteroidota bacterium]|nr:hypothetical protein [Bacteroidota bacterium]